MEPLQRLTDTLTTGPTVRFLYLIVATITLWLTLTDFWSQIDINQTAWIFRFIRENIETFSFLFVLMFLYILYNFFYYFSRVQIKFQKNGQYIWKQENIITCRVSAYSKYKYATDNSFRLEYIKDTDGNFLPYERLWFEREAGVGRVPLRMKQHKFFYIVRYDSATPDSFYLLTVHPSHTIYTERQDDVEWVSKPIELPAKEYVIKLGLYPNHGFPSWRSFRIKKAGETISFLPERKFFPCRK